MLRLRRVDSLCPNPQFAVHGVLRAIIRIAYWDVYLPRNTAYVCPACRVVCFVTLMVARAHVTALILSGMVHWCLVVATAHRVFLRAMATRNHECIHPRHVGRACFLLGMHQQLVGTGLSVTLAYTCPAPRVQVLMTNPDPPGIRCSTTVVRCGRTGGLWWPQPTECSCELWPPSATLEPMSFLVCVHMLCWGLPGASGGCLGSAQHVHQPSKLLCPANIVL
jgi:hypothetical protein